jgi:hypothetical protein
MTDSLCTCEEGHICDGNRGHDPAGCHHQCPVHGGTALAPEGHIWVCLACGKTSKTRYGFDEKNRTVSMRGWDASCVLNSRLIPEDKIVERNQYGRVTRIDAQEPQSACPDTTGTS